MWVVMGPTGSGKTALAEAIKDRVGGTLLNADAFQVYKGMDIGTAKSSRKSEYELLDLIAPNESFGVGSYIHAAIPFLERIHSNCNPAILVGGTGFYIRALTSGYQDLFPAPDPELREELNQIHLQHGIERLVSRLLAIDPDSGAKVDLMNPMRVKRAIERKLSPSQKIHFKIPAFLVKKVAILPDHAVLTKQISQRVDKMMQEGWIDEVISLRNQGFGPSDPGFRAHGYRSLFEVIEGRMELAEATEKTCAEVRQYAKRQRTWLRKEPDLRWIEGDSIEKQLEFVLNEPKS